MDEMKLFDAAFIEGLLEKASSAERKRCNFDLRNSESDQSQRMLNAMVPGTVVPVHRHDDTAETVVCLLGRFYEIIYEECPGNDGRMAFREISRHLICPESGFNGMQIPSGCWHSVEVLEPSVIFEAKDGPYKPVK